MPNSPKNVPAIVTAKLLSNTLATTATSRPKTHPIVNQIVLFMPTPFEYLSIYSSHEHIWSTTGVTNLSTYSTDWNWSRITKRNVKAEYLEDSLCGVAETHTFINRDVQTCFTFSNIHKQLRDQFVTHSNNFNVIRALNTRGRQR